MIRSDLNEESLFKADQLLQYLNPGLELSKSKKNIRAIILMQSYLHTQELEKLKKQEVLVEHKISGLPKIYKSLKSIQENLANPDRPEVWILGSMGFGAPSLICQFEILYALGVREFYVIGTAAALSSEIEVGEPAWIHSAIADESTSKHYSIKLEFQNTSVNQDSVSLETYWSNKYFGQFQKKLTSLRSWTTDAPYRETSNKRQYFYEKSCRLVEMEASAIFAFADFRNCQASIFVSISDHLLAHEWIPSFKDKKIVESQRHILELLIGD